MYPRVSSPVAAAAVLSLLGAVMVMAMSQRVWTHHGCGGGDFFTYYAVYIIVTKVIKKEIKKDT